MLPWSMVKYAVILFWSSNEKKNSENCMIPISSQSRNSEIVIKAASENNRIWKLLDLSIDQDYISTIFGFHNIYFSKHDPSKQPLSEHTQNHYRYFFDSI